MKIVGMTGGMGVGKTTIAQLFMSLGVECWDADHFVREILEKNKNIIQQIADYFGKEILLHTNVLDRKKIREIIFTNIEKKIWLENLLHPLVLKDIQAVIAKRKSPYAVVMIPLLMEKGPFDFVDRVLWIDASVDSQLQRMMSRDKLTREQAEAIIAHQMPREQRAQYADDIILNEGNEQKLRKAVENLHKKYLAL